MLHEVELLEELPYYRSTPRNLHQEPPISVIAPDVRTPSKQQGPPLPQHYVPPPRAELVVSAAAYIADVATDVAACWAFFVEGRTSCAAAVATSVLLAAVATNACSLYWYSRRPASKLQWVARALSHALLLGLICRLFGLLCARRSLGPEEGGGEGRKRRNALKAAAIRQERQAALLGLLHSLLESTPQLVLQLYTLAQRNDTDLKAAIQGLCVLSSLFQSSWSVSAYNGAVHRTTAGKRPLAAGARVLHMLWHLCTAGSRACTLALFAQEYGAWLLPFLVGHWGVMTVWLMHQQTRLCRKGKNPRQCREYAGNMLAGLAYVIYFLNVKAEPTRYKYSAYYATVFIENCVLTTLWFLKNDPGAWYHVPALVAVASSFTSGIVFMLLYYGFCHHTSHPKDRAARCC